MSIQMSNTGPAVSDERIRDFEISIGCSLPPEFRTFLLQYNGGQPTPFVMDINGLPGGSSDVQVFFGLNRSINTSDLEWNVREMVGRLRSGLCPIARDSGGNLYCLVLSGEEEGAIYYENMQPELGAIWYGHSKPKDHHEFKVTSSLSGFLIKLRD